MNIYLLDSDGAMVWEVGLHIESHEEVYLLLRFELTSQLGSRDDLEWLCLIVNKR